METEMSNAHLEDERREDRLCTVNFERWMRRSQRRIDFSISEKLYKYILTVQHGVCAMCKSEIETSDDSYLDIEPRKVDPLDRTLICPKCDVFLAAFRYDPKIFYAMIAYIQEHEIEPQLSNLKNAGIIK